MTMANFLATKSTTQSNVTGCNGNIPVKYDNIVYDDTTSYSGSTGIFTAPNTGTYLFTVAVIYSGMASNNGLGTIYLNKNSNSDFYRMMENNPYSTRDSNNQGMMNGSITMKLNAGDTIFPAISILGSVTDTVSLPGSEYTYFSGVQLK